jgi:hypothetical protein
LARHPAAAKHDAAAGGFDPRPNHLDQSVGEPPVFDYSLDLANTDFRRHPELYRIGRGEQGVLLVEPYKSEILPHWRFKTVGEAKRPEHADPKSSHAGVGGLSVGVDGSGDKHSSGTGLRLQLDELGRVRECPKTPWKPTGNSVQCGKCRRPGIARSGDVKS